VQGLILPALSAVIRSSLNQLLDRVTRTEDTIVLCHLGVPLIDSDEWSLSIDGVVRHPLRLTLAT
jgi:hypothetical protein